MEATDMDYCMTCGLLKEIIALGSCKPCYRKHYYQAHKSQEIERATAWKTDNRERRNATARKNYHKSFVKKRCPRCNKQILINPKKTLVKCSSCGSKFRVKHTLSSSNKNKHGIKLEPL